MYYVAHYTIHNTRDGIRRVHLTPISIGSIPLSYAAIVTALPSSFYSLLLFYTLNLFIPLLSHFKYALHPVIANFISIKHRGSVHES